MMAHADPSNSGITELSASNSTMDDVRRCLETALNRPILDETGLKATYDIEVHGNARNTEEFLGLHSPALAMCRSWS